VPLSKSILRPLFIVFFALTFFGSYGQERCGTVEYMAKLRARQLIKENDSQFEQWLKQKLQAPRASSVQRKKSGPYKIPIVIHVIHNGEAVGSGANIPEAQIISQLKVLNEDYQRKNADAVNTPAEFKAVAGSLDIEFVLAKRNPEGLTTNGIVRVNGHRPSWTSNDGFELTQLSYWPAEDYFNIWVCNITDYLGFSQFPVSDLPGLENSPDNRLTDGVIIWYRSFGSIDDGNFNLDPDYNKGRTLTHEASHFFGLRHIWGDVDGCVGTDYVDDTPNQDGYTTGCPIHPRSTCDPAVVSMFQNYTDYTDDACMNLFTKDQVERMQTVIENSPRRASLLTSKGLLNPDPVNNDLGLRAVVSPEPTQCSHTVVPVVRIKNYGKNNVTSARLRLIVNGVPVETKTITLSLAQLDSADVTFNTINANTGTSTLTFEIQLTNGVTDGDSTGNDNTLTTTVFVPAEISLPFTENFSLLSSNWTIQNPDQQITWQTVSLPGQSPSNFALALPFFDYELGLGQQDILLTPVFDLSNASQAVLYFDVANAQFDQSHDALRVIAITNCSSVADGVQVYDKSGFELATTGQTNSYFIPNSADDWRTEFIDLTQFTGNNFVQLAFIGINGYGNNLYLDNITVATLLNDVSLSQIASPGLVTCDGSSATLLVQNTGTETVQTLRVDYQVNGGTVTSQNFSSLNLGTGKETSIELTSLNLAEGGNILAVTISNPNGLPDQNSANNSKQIKVVVNQAEDQIPLRQNFDKPFADAWTIANPDDGTDWKTINTNYDQSLYFSGFNNLDVGDESWLVSPVLDFSQTYAASLTFDISYRSGTRRDGFRIMVSEDCGKTYHGLTYQIPDVESLSEAWIPESDSDWFSDQYLDLSAYAGQPDIRIAFVVTNAGGNNVYLDNIEFFLASDPRSIIIEDQFSIFGYNMENIADSDLKIGFNLDEKQDVRCDIFDTVGRLIVSSKWTDVLNQVFELPVQADQKSGAYIVRVNIGGKYASKLIYLPR
jgi:hypothetical protein